ncbi:unnamed protein product [Cylicocyclus nassatus]|uniref:Uncharacterized protein n=1 Tax=Cylicocyclus nassatus TaxID=53992 RepID=A0AA36GNA3_CYLNA|nr:unnamed protein product [Cylicocyclus nassatus]
MDETEEAAAEPLWKVIRLSLPISDRKTLLAIAVGFATITAGTTYVFVKYREKKREKSSEQSSTLEGSEEVELDRTPPSTSSLKDVSWKCIDQFKHMNPPLRSVIAGSAIDDKFIYSTGSSALSEISPYSTKSISSLSDTERAKTSSRKEEQIVKITPTKKPQEGYLVKKSPSKIELAKTQDQDSGESDENRERSLLPKDILPSISLEERDEGPPLSRQVDDEERSSISVSIGSLRAPVVDIKPAAQSVPDELITGKVELREGITEKVKSVVSQPKIIPSPNRETLASKEVQKHLQKRGTFKAIKALENGELEAEKTLKSHTTS